MANGVESLWPCPRHLLDTGQSGEAEEAAVCRKPPLPGVILHRVLIPAPFPSHALGQGDFSRNEAIPIESVDEPGASTIKHTHLTIVLFGDLTYSASAKAVGLTIGNQSVSCNLYRTMSESPNPDVACLVFAKACDIFYSIFRRVTSEFRDARFAYRYRFAEGSPGPDPQLAIRRFEHAANAVTSQPILDCVDPVHYRIGRIRLSHKQTKPDVACQPDPSAAVLEERITAIWIRQALFVKALSLPIGAKQIESC